MRRERRLPPRWALAAGALAALIIALVLGMALQGGSGRHRPRAPALAQTFSAPHVPAARPSSYAVGLRTIKLVDGGRSLQLRNGLREPRTLTTYVRYPALGSTAITDRVNAPPARRYGPFPLVVFGHGFAVTPGLYNGILRAWARAGYVVAAPVFPLENTNAPGGPDESDLINQPADMRFVISRMLAEGASAESPLHGLLDPAHIAVSGQSDGGDTALTVAYDRPYRDPRVGAAVIFSGAELPGAGPYSFSPGEPPLLATQGTADTVNPPGLTSEFFEAAQRPKYLLSLLGAEHLPPYSSEQPQVRIVEHASIAFLDAYLKGDRRALSRLAALGNVAGVSTLTADR